MRVDVKSICMTKSFYLTFSRFIAKSAGNQSVLNGGKQVFQIREGEAVATEFNAVADEVAVIISKIFI